MCVMQSYYLVCTNCRRMFRSQHYGGHFESPEEAKELAKSQGWFIDVRVENGSLWDFCPKCWEKHEIVG